jgi:hypothetical protein
VRQPGRADEIADRVDAGLAGAQPFVDDDVAPVDGDTGVFEADGFDIGDNPDGKDDALNGELAPRPPFSMRAVDIFALALECADARPGVELDPLFLKGLRAKSEIPRPRPGAPGRAARPPSPPVFPQAAYQGGARGQQYTMAKVGK